MYNDQITKERRMGREANFGEAFVNFVAGILLVEGLIWYGIKLSEILNK